MQWPGVVSLAFALFIVASVTDWADGYVARKYNMITDFGKLMDALADKVLMVGMFVLLLSIPDFLPRWSIFFVLIIITREFLITGLRLVAATRGKVLAAETGGKVKTVVQIVAISLLLLARGLDKDYGFEGLPVTVVFYLGMLAFALSTLLTLQSGFQYLYKYGHLLKPSTGTAQE